MKANTFGFIGLGLIGGSIAKAIREHIPGSYLIAYDINENSLNAAVADGVVNKAVSEINDSFRSCDMIFLCAPVQKNDLNLQTVRKVISPDCLLTDVGSVKSDIHLAIEAAGLNSQFIGGHPMAGSERIGYTNSKSVLLENAYFILTPTAEVSPDMITTYKTLVEALGALPLILTPSEHDYVTAAISHLPHVIAASLVNLVHDSDSKEGVMKMIAAGGFKDITRIASSSPTMWQQICLTNTAHISELLSSFIHSLEDFKEHLDNRDADTLYSVFNNARIYRDSFSNASSGPIKISYIASIDVADKTGAIASIVALLAEHSISIKNIGITHNREDESGILHIEFYSKEDLENAKKILNEKEYFLQNP